MTVRARKLIQEALGFSAAERADLAAELLASLPLEPAIDEQKPNAAWIAEIERRARVALADPEAGEPWESVRAETLDQLRARRG